MKMSSNQCENLIYMQKQSQLMINLADSMSIYLETRRDLQIEIADLYGQDLIAMINTSSNDNKIFKRNIHIN